MRARVAYSSDGVPEGGELRKANWLVGDFAMRGSTAVLTSMQPRPDEERVYGDDCIAALAALDKLPFVQASRFGEVE